MDGIVSKINRVGQDIAQKVKNTNRVEKLEFCIQEERLAQKELYSEIGRVFYETVSDRSQLDVPIATLLLKIDDSVRKVCELQEKIAQIKNEKRCPVCGRSYNPDFVYCAGCGTKLDPAFQQEIEYRCPKCKEKINTDDLFCVHCGSKLK